MTFFDKGLHDGQGSISFEKVTLPVMISVIFEALVPENDEISFHSVACGRRNSLQEGFLTRCNGTA